MNPEPERFYDMVEENCRVMTHSSAHSGRLSKNNPEETQTVDFFAKTWSLFFRGADSSLTDHSHETLK